LSFSEYQKNYQSDLPIFDNAMPNSTVKSNSSANSPAEVIRLSPSIQPRHIQSDFYTDIVNSKFSFEHLHISDFNSIPFGAAKELITAEKPRFNSLFITSEGPGLGKTHIAQAIAIELQKNKRLNVCYTTAEAFAQEFSTSIKTGAIENFKYKYRKQIDVLIMDDLDQLKGKPKTQFELLFTYEALLNENKKMIFVCNTSPTRLKGIDPRLLSRFQSALVTQISKPRMSEVCEIISKKTAAFNLMLTPEMTRFIAANIKHSITEIEGVIVKLIAEISIRHKPLSMQLLADVLAESSVRSATKLSLENIAQITCKNFGLTPDQIKSKRKKQQIADVRMLVMYFTRKYTDLTQREIGEYYGKKHNAVIHAYDTIESKLNNIPVFKLQVEHIENELKDLANRAANIMV
jgi:chromosomal replication initiator protein